MNEQLPYGDSVKVLLDAGGALHEAAQRIQEFRDAMDAAYLERNRLVAFLSKCCPSHLMRHPESDESWGREWIWIVCVHGPNGAQMTWHIHDSHLDLFKHLDRDVENHWDGHTTEQKYERLSRLRGIAL